MLQLGKGLWWVCVVYCRWNVCFPGGLTSGISTGKWAVSFTGSHRTLITGAGEHKLVVREVAASESVRWQFCILFWGCRWSIEVHHIEGNIIHCGGMVDSRGVAEWVWDVEVFTPAPVTFILLWELYSKCIIQSSHKVTEEYFFWEISYLLYVVTIGEGCVDSIYEMVDDMWFKVFHPELQCWDCSIPYRIFSCKRPILQSVHGAGCRWNKIMEWCLTGICSRWRHWHERVLICVWWIQVGWSKLLAHIIWCGGTCFLCMYFFKSKNPMFLGCQSRSAHVWSWN